jgi:hypothetical protein
MDFKFWRSWLLAVSALIILFGLFMALLSWSPLFAVFDIPVNGVFWAGSGPDAHAKAFMLWAYGMLGATMAGWGVFLAYIVRHPFSKKEPWSRDCIAIGVSAWFVVDSFMSAYTGAFFNVAINAILFALIAIPLVLSRADFKALPDTVQI